MKLFSTEHANALIPRLAPLVDELLSKRRDLAIKLLESHTMGNVTPTVGANPHSPRLAEPRSPFPPLLFGELKGDIIRLIQRIESHGCILKDIDLGLLDFPAQRDGNLIYLCWKSGEPAVSHWHTPEGNFASRKPL